MDEIKEGMVFDSNPREVIEVGEKVAAHVHDLSITVLCTKQSIKH